MHVSFSSIYISNPYHDSNLQISENGDGATYGFWPRGAENTPEMPKIAPPPGNTGGESFLMNADVFFSFCIWSSLPPAPPVPPAFTDTHIFMHFVTTFLCTGYAQYMYLSYD